MILNPDCIRDILIVTADLTEPDENGYTTQLTIEDYCEAEKLSSYSRNEIAYTLNHLIEENMLIKGKMYISDKTPRIKDISSSGRQLLSLSTDNSNWDKIKKTLKNSVLSGAKLTASAILQVAVKTMLG